MATSNLLATKLESHPYLALCAAIRARLTCDLLKPEYRGHPNPMYGHCYVACEVLHFLTGGELKPYVVRHEGGTHWFLRDDDGNIVDPTYDQFETEVPYDQGRGCGFLTKQPSKRAQEVLRRLA